MIKLCRNLLLTTFLIINITNTFGQKQKIWIDADSGNETDDIYAIARAVYEPSVSLVGLSSAHFNNADLVTFQKWNQYNTLGIKTVEISQQLNEEVLIKAGKSIIPHPIGADRQMGRSWGGKEPRNSPAAQVIIATVKKLAPNEKLSVICLGALTNIASAIALDTSIAKHLVCYILGAKYDLDRSCWNKSEFNIRNDLNAFDYLLDNPNVSIVIMPVNIAASYSFKRDFLYSFFKDTSPVQKMLKNRWLETNPNDKERTLWDLALVEACINQGMSTTKEVQTPPENLPRVIRIFSAIDPEKMRADFLAVLKDK